MSFTVFFFKKYDSLLKHGKAELFVFLQFSIIIIKYTIRTTNKNGHCKGLQNMHKS